MKMETIIEGFISGCRVNTTRDTVYIEAGKYEYIGKYFEFKGGEYKFIDLINKPKSSTWYHIYLDNHKIILSTEVNNNLGRRISSILTAKQTWLDKILRRVRLRILNYVGDFYTIEDLE